MLKQLSIYAENKKGVMQNITGILKNEDINILGSVTNDSAEYGIVRMVVSEPDKAMEALIAAGYLSALSPSETVEKTTLSLQEYFLPANLSVSIFP